MLWMYSGFRSLYKWQTMSNIINVWENRIIGCLNTAFSGICRQLFLVYVDIIKLKSEFFYGRLHFEGSITSLSSNAWDVAFSEWNPMCLWKVNLALCGHKFEQSVLNNSLWLLWLAFSCEVFSKFTPFSPTWEKYKALS